MALLVSTGQADDEMTHTFKFQKCLNHKTKIERDTHSTQTVTVSAIKLTKKNKMVKTIKNMI